MNALQGFLNSSRGELDILLDRIFYWVVEMWWGAIVTIKTFFKGKNLVGESTCGGGFLVEERWANLKNPDLF